MGRQIKGFRKSRIFSKTGESSSDNGEAKNATPKSEQEEEEEEKKKKQHDVTDLVNFCSFFL